MPIVSMKDITVQYGSNVVIEGLSLDVERGENLAVVGPSSCGKTTLMRALCGFIKITSGEILLNGAPVSSVSPRVMVAPEKRNIGVVFQDYAVWPHMTVWENVHYPLKIQKVGKGEAEARTQEAIDNVNLAGLENRMPYQLSGGQQQRVALARALVAEPKLMLLDEPLTNLDANLREEMRFEIRALQRRKGITVLYVTHDQEIALAISDRMAVLDKNGTICQIGTPAEVFETPSNAFVFRFMGVSNMIPVDVGADGVFIRGTRTVLTKDVPMTVPRDPIFGCRPSDIDLVRDPDAGLPMARVTRVNLLGPIVDQRLDCDGTELRSQIETHRAMDGGLIFNEGDMVGIRIANPLLFEANTMEGVVTHE